jgi:solute carrier family 25 phosphate transporter 3
MATCILWNKKISTVMSDLSSDRLGRIFASIYHNCYYATGIVVEAADYRIMEELTQKETRAQGEIMTHSHVPREYTYASRRSITTTTTMLLSMLLGLFSCSPLCQSFTPSQSRHSHSRRQFKCIPLHAHTGTPKLKVDSLDNDDRPGILAPKQEPGQSSIDFTSRRQVLASIASAAMLLPSLAQAADTGTSVSTSISNDPLEGLLLGDGQWKALDRTDTSRSTSSGIIPPTFCTYAARLLIQYDVGVADWWSNLETKYSLVDDDKRATKLGRAFGSLAKSIELALDPVLVVSPIQQQQQQQIQSSAAGYETLWDLFVERYGNEPDAMRQISLLFALLPAADQPVSRLRRLSNIPAVTAEKVLPIKPVVTTSGTTITTSLSNDLTSLLGAEYQCVQVKSNLAFALYPVIHLFEVGVDEEFGQTAVATAFGPLSEAPLTRELPNYSFDTYRLFAISGAAGCALTHTVVIPLDVVKTRAQTDPTGYTNIVEVATQILQKEGLSGLLLGAQATLAGYSWYGMSVYPSYTFFKRFLTHDLLSPAVAAVHANEIALVAGAIASVVASLGLTPLEAARIRAVAEPETYRPLGLLGTLGVIAEENSTLGWKNLYAGLPSLLTRQVIFGSVKFLAFERACEVIFGNWPVLRDATWTTLAVSLVAGGISGTLSSIVSQPADSVLTYVARTTSDERSSLGLIEGCRIMVEKEGVGSLYRGLGSRCLWAGSIIAGQFLLYDVFRTYLGVSADDLSQVYQVILPEIN